MINRKKSVSMAFLLVLMFSAIVGVPSATPAAAQRWIKITTCGKGFLMEFPGLKNHPPILHVQGTPYEMGYQHGYLLADRIIDMISGFMTPIYSMFGGWLPGMGVPTPENWETGRWVLLNYGVYPYFYEVIQDMAPEFYEEMLGVADGLADAGYTQDTLWDDILIANCMPDVVDLFGCSDFAAWSSATVNGKLIHGLNQDYESFNILPNNTIVTIAWPQYESGCSGNPFLGVGWPGMVCHLGGMSAAGISIGEPTSYSSDRDLEANPEIPHFMHMREVLQYANSIEDAINIMDYYGGTLGWNIFTTDAKVPTAATIEVSCTKMGVVYPMEGIDAIWSTNHYNAYPGWQGYPEDGYNMVRDQMEYWGVPWEEVNTIDKWQAWLQANRYSTWARYERLRELIEENYGKIDVSKAIEFMSDPVLSRAGPRIQLTPPIEQMYGIVRPIISQSLASIYSCIFVPSDGMAWVAAGAYPAQAGTYWPISLPFHLLLMRLYARFN